MSDEKIRGFCKDCNKFVVAFRSKPNHVLHLLLSIFTLGLWVFVWIGLSIKIGGWKCSECGSKRISQTTSTFAKVLLILVAFFVMTVIIGAIKQRSDKKALAGQSVENTVQTTSVQTKKSVEIPVEKAIETPIESPIDKLAKDTPSNLSPYGELAEMFNFGSKNTDLQRENKLKEITGKVVQWQLPVYEVKSSGNGYRIQTNTSVKIGNSNSPVGTFIKVTARNETEKRFIETIKTGDTVTFKGIIKDTTMRNIEIEPAILVLDSANSDTPAQPEPKQAVDIEQPSQVEAQQQSEPKPATTTTSQNKTWTGDWGNGIIATVSSEPCQNRELVNQDYDYLMTVTIPVARLKSPDDAWRVLGDKAVTITGCWSKRDFNMIHAKLTRKKGNKTWEQDFKLDDGNWINRADGKSPETTKPQSANPLDEANAKINVVWNATTKQIRTALLPEQRAWLKQRESDCSLVVEKINCMTTMTNLRTEILKQKIAVLSK